MDNSSTGVGAVLSQQQSDPTQLHPCAFYSKKLSPTEQNYDIRNRELLAIKGANHHFEVITDHRNLEYLRDAKRLNLISRSRINLKTRIVGLMPCHAFINLSLITILLKLSFPPAMIVSPILWSIDKLLTQANCSEPAPPIGPEGLLYVPPTYRLPLMDSWIIRLRALDTQVVYVPSRSYVIVIGGPPWLRISPGTSRDARSVPLLTLPGDFQKENWFLCPLQTVRGPIWASNS